MCKLTILGICFTPAVPPTEVIIFGFSEFLASFALLVLVYNYSSTTYRFRTSIAPLRFQTIAYISLAFTGFGTLVNDVWVAQSWYAPALGLSHAFLQSLFAVIFLITILAWLFFAFIRPPIFGKSNAERYVVFAYKAVVDGSDAELAEVVREISRSANAIVRLAPIRGDRLPNEGAPRSTGIAHDLLLLLSNRRVAKKIAALSPGTMIAIMVAMRSQDRVPAVAGQLVKSVVEEALIDKDSIIFHEMRQFSTDLIGLAQPLSRSLFSDFNFFERMSDSLYSPLDVDYRVFENFDSDQFSAYCQLVTLVFEQLLASGNIERESYGLNRAFENISKAGQGMHTVNSGEPSAWRSDEVRKLGVGIRFVSDALTSLNKVESFEVHVLRRKENDYNKDVIDQLANMAYEMILNAASVKGPPDFAWSVYYSTVWGRLFSLSSDGPAKPSFPLQTIPSFIQ